MKKSLLVIVLLYKAQYAFADATFKFNSLKGSKSQPAYSYFIKAQKLKYSEAGSEKSNVFNQQNQLFTSLDHNTGTISTLNEDILNKHVLELNQQRMEKMKYVEKELQKKLKGMSAVEQQTGESLLNQLKYPELYGEHTLLKVKALNKTKLVKQTECKRYQLYKKNVLLTEYCMASPKALKLSPQDYQALRSFYAFNYKMQTKILIALGKTGFTMIDYERQNMPGIVIESIHYKKSRISQHLVLKSHNSEPLDASIFNIKADKQ